jgi:excisionase family DNA binding protein
MNTDGSRKLLDVKGVAERLGVSPFTVRAWLRQRRLEHVKLGRRILVPESAIRRFVDMNTIPAREERNP